MAYRVDIATRLTELAEPVVSTIVDLLANRIGADAAYWAPDISIDAAERWVCQVPALARDTGADWSDHWPRPELIAVALLPDHPPASFTWRGVRRRVRRADGPARVFGEWWKRDAELVAVRDYFRDEDEAGERYWIYRAGDGEDAETGSHRWFLHGVFG